MKSKNLFFTLALVLFGFVSNSNVQAADVDLVKNGDFESGTANWQGDTTTGIVNSNGEQFTFLGTKGISSEIYQQGISLPSNATDIKIRFNYAFDFNGGMGMVAILDENDGLAPLTGIAFVDSSDDTGGYIGYVSGDLTAFKGKNVTLVIAVNNAGGLAGFDSSLYVDNISIVATTPATDEPVNLYRFWSAKYSGHFFTASGNEKNHVITAYSDYVWKYENVAYQVFEQQVTDTYPVYRFWSAKYSGHFYTISEIEKASVIDNYSDDIWKYEGVAYYTYKTQQPNTKPVYRFWSSKYKHHFYTASEAEKNEVISKYDNYTWKYEGIAWYVVE